MLLLGTFIIEPKAAVFALFRPKGYRPLTVCKTGLCLLFRAENTRSSGILIAADDRFLYFAMQSKPTRR
jgi:hypothetical protein